MLAIFYSLTGSPTCLEYLGDVFPFPSISELQELASVLSSSSLPLFSSTSSPDNVAPCPGYCSGYGYYTYYYYLDEWTGHCQASPPACSCSRDAGPDSVMHRLLQTGVAVWAALLCVLALVLFAMVALWRGIAHRCAGFTHWVCPCGVGCRRDTTEIGHACLFAGCAVLLVIARRIPFGGAKLRRIALRYRPYTSASIETGDPVFVRTPSPRSSDRSSSQRGSSAGSSRRPLALLQAEHRLISGGCWIGGRRVTLPRRRVWRTTFNPSSGKGDCLFMVLAKLVGCRMPPSIIRRHVREHAVRLLRTNEVLHCGRSLGGWLYCLGITEENYLRRLATRKSARWGNTVDVAVAAHLYGVRFRIFDLRSSEVIYDAGKGMSGLGAAQPLDIGYFKNHFVAGRLDRRTRYGGGRIGWCAKVVMLITMLLASGYAYAFAYSSCSSTAQTGFLNIRQGGMRRGHIAGTGYLNPDGTDRPFDIIGEGLFDRTLHRIPNAHDVAALEQRYVEETNIERRALARPLFSAVATDDEYEGETLPGTGRPPLVRRLRAILGSAVRAPHLAVGSTASYSYGLRDFGDGVLHTVLNNHDVSSMTAAYFAHGQHQEDYDARPASPMILVGGDNSSFPRTGRNRAIQQTRVILHSAVGAPHVVEGTHAVSVQGIPEFSFPAQHTVLNPNMLPALEDDHIVLARTEALQLRRPYFSAVFSEDESDDEMFGDQGPGYCRQTNVASLRFVLSTAEGAPHVLAGLPPDIMGDASTATANAVLHNS
eukprot:5157185-Amphidinium_carterae.2